MSSLVIYLIKANIALTLFYLAYRFGLRRLTFYNLNRFFLLFGIVFSAVFPLVNLNTFFQQHQQLAGSVAYYAPDWSTLQQYVQPQNQFTVWTLIAYVFWAGVIVMTIRFCVQMMSLFRIHLRTKSGFIYEEKIRLMHDHINPFSFFKNIYINPELHTENELEKILHHEKIHVKGWHSADILAGEINNIFYWFNPGAWMMKTAIQENLEFITDRKILSSGMDAKSYQYSLIKVSSIPFANPLANNFNFSHLKKRIKMMNRKRSSRFHLLRYLLLLPVIAIAVFFINSSRAQSFQHDKDNVTNSAKNFTLESLNDPFRNQHFNSKGYEVVSNTNSGINTVRSSNGVLLGYFNLYTFTPKQLADFNKRYGTSLTYEDVQAFKNYAQVLNNHPTISNYSYESKKQLYIWTKGNPMPTAYNLNKTKDRNQLLKKYGIIPPDYIAVVKHDDDSSHLQKEYMAFLKRNSTVESIAWGGNPETRTTTYVIVHLKNGIIEKYYLNNHEEMKKAEAKYGKFPAPPPPPPVSTKAKSISSHNITDTSIRNDRYYAQLSY